MWIADRSLNYYFWLPMKALELCGKGSIPGLLVTVSACAQALSQTQPGIVVFALDGLSRVRPHDSPGTSSVVTIKAARNEFEPFQIVVRAGTAPLKAVNVELSDLRGPGNQVIPRRHFTLYREHYLEVTRPSPKSKEGAGWYPDALVPFLNPLDGKPITKARFIGAPFEVAPDSNQPVWVDVFVPKDTPPGDYTGTVTVTAQNQKSVSLPIKLTVWNFTLPDTPTMRSNFGDLDGRLVKLHHTKEESPEFRVLERRYAEATAAHRLCPPIPAYLMPEIKPDGSIDSSASQAQLKEWTDRFHVTGFPLNLIGGDPLGKDREHNLRYLQAIYAYLKKNGWEKYAYIYVLDEPNDAAAYEQVRKRGGFIHQAQPGIKVLCTEQPTPQDSAWGSLVGSVDIWVPLWTLFEERSATERFAAGEELWSYTALCQGEKGKDTPYWEMDFPLLDYRIPGWASWRYGITGLLYWTTVYWEKVEDPWTNPATYVEGTSVFNGEGSLFYPGADAGFAGPVVSMRLKQIREGLEDYEYLNLLARRGDKRFADECAHRLVTSWSQWNQDPADLYALREQIAKKLEETANRR
jgi:hypothetical protein